MIILLEVGCAFGGFFHACIMWVFLGGLFDLWALMGSLAVEKRWMWIETEGLLGRIGVRV
jgi:hypothetical protein